MTEARASALLAQRPPLSALIGQDTPWDVVVIGGGITGAGILLEAARRGHRALLLEQKDFAWGTSSRSSKMVHGGLRYIAQGDIRLTRHALQERERLLDELPDLVVRMPYLFAVRTGQFPGRWPLTLVLKLYDWLAGIRDHQWVPRRALLAHHPLLQPEGLLGAMRYTDALTDDSRLVIRVLQEACLEGAHARNYTAVRSIHRTHPDGLHTLSVHDEIDGRTTAIAARHVFNATGLWADQLSGTPPVVRPQRGTHVFVSHAKLPVSECLTFLHPRDQRPVFVFPWKGQTCIGTTDLDHQGRPLDEPTATEAEIDYLLEVVRHEMPAASLHTQDVLSTMAGVRPIIASGKGRDPSKERRDHLVWQHDGVISVSGGKLTTFRQIALDALLAAGLLDRRSHQQAHGDRAQRCFNHEVTVPLGLNHPLRGAAHGTQFAAHVDWVLQHEMVVHLDDLLLRRLRIGNVQDTLSPEQLRTVREACTRWLGWQEGTWQQEWQRYQDILTHHYRLPVRATTERVHHG